MKRVAVIGAGVSGLVSVKTCIEEGLHPICFEKQDFIGGTWYYREDDRSLESPCIYEGMLTNICKEMMAYSDFPFPKDAPPFTKGTDIIQYYIAYAKHFDLFKYIRFNTDVLKVEPTDDFEETGRWTVRVKDKEGAVTTEVFDAVFLCSGLYTSAFIPQYPGLDEFKGQIVHSCQFRKGSDFKGKTILVVGACQSAGDISVLCSDHAKKVYISLRNGTWVIPRVIEKEPQDAHVNRRWKARLPDWIHRRTTKRSITSMLDYKGLGLQSSKHPCNSSVMVNDNVPIKIMSGAIRVRSGIERFEGSEVVFDDGSRVIDVDCVIFATGYNHKLPFVDDSILSDDLGKLDLYYHILPPRLAQPTLSVIGYVEARGGTGPTSELQARWAVGVLKGNVKLPSQEKMLADVERRRNKIFEQYKQHRPRIQAIEYQDLLAKDIGVLPNLFTLFLGDPVLAFYYFFGPAFPPSYRLVGPHAKKDARTMFLNSSEDLMHGITLSTVRRNAPAPCGDSSGYTQVVTCFTLGACLLVYQFFKLYFT